MQMIESRTVILLSSSVLAYENSRNANDLCRSWTQRCIWLAHYVQPVNAEIRHLADALEQQGFRALDALHVACAEVANAHYFVTCDDRLVRRYRRRGGTLQICDPIDFVRAVAGE